MIPSLPSDHSLVVTDEKDSLQKEKNGQDHLSPRKDTVILIVEDEKNIRDLLKDVLFDYVIHEAKDGVEALKEIEHNHVRFRSIQNLLPKAETCNCRVPPRDGGRRIGASADFGLPSGTLFPSASL